MTSYQFTLWFLLTICCFSGAQHVKGTNSYETDTLSVFYEKIYLHTDRSFYHAGDDIWFKAYLVDAFSNQLTDHSEVVYIELISSDSLVLQQSIIRQHDGAGIGDFHLPDTILPGFYFLRAYTKYMRNFSNNFFFTKEIRIENFLISSDVLLKKQAIKALVDVQFFPEGGSLVYGVFSNVAFKAVNSSGYGCIVSGFVISSEGDTVTNFQTEHLGMGSFSFIPEKHLGYYATGKSENGIEFKTEIPSIFETGLIMQVKTNINDLFLTLETNNETLLSFINSPLILKGSFHNKIFFETSLNIEKSNHYVIPTEDFPEGIIKLTIYGKDTLPLCERLIYIDIKDSVNITISADKPRYSARERISLEVSVNQNTLSPVNANLSMAVIDQNSMKLVKPYASNIASWFLLESEIKGNIEQPGYYFDNSNINRLKHLDLLLLTQGWRDFRWKFISGLSTKMSHLPEKGLTISGRLRNTMVNKPIPDAKITLGIGENKIYSMMHTQTDSTGRFAFDGLHFTGENKILLRTTNDKQRKIGWLLIDTVKILPPEISIPKLPTEELEPEVTDEIKQDAFYKSIINRRYSLNDTILIEEVVVKRKKSFRNEDDGHFRIYTNPDIVYKVEEQDWVFSDIFQLINVRIAGVYANGIYPEVTVSMRASVDASPMFLLNGIQVDLDWIASIPVDFIDKVEVLKFGSAAFLGPQAANGVISVFTKKWDEIPEKEVFHTIESEIFGYSNSRIFYSPNYEKPKSENEKPDLRTTIHWEPQIIMSNSEPVKVSFFNSNISSTILVDLQGITQNGIPVTGQFEYEVK